ncbi:MAG: DUF5596 domain-containing protein [Clostridia bacterium]|nr:DUF5596 domain-containing protein [Clostridia bacterium]
MRAYLQEFMELTDFPAESRPIFLRAYDQIRASANASPRFDALIKAYDEDKMLDYAALIKEAGALGEVAGVVHFTAELLIFMCLSKRLRERYLEEGISEEIWLASMTDLKYKAVECYLIHGIWGTFVAIWNDNFFRMNRFALGRLQFEIKPFEFDYEKNGIVIKKGDPVLNTHIPRSETPLTHESVLDSYKLAAAFFKNRLGGAPVAFYCSSWLFFEKHREMLKPTSNIYRFIADFDMLEQGVYDDYTQTWRLFDKFYTGNPDDMPADSSLRRAYIDLMKKGEPIGWGKGIFLYKD